MWNLDGQRPIYLHVIWEEASAQQRNGAEMDQQGMGWNPRRADQESFKSCGIENALDATEDEAVWDEEGDEREDEDDTMENEFEKESEGEGEEEWAVLKKRFFSEPPWFFLEPPNWIKFMANNVSLIYTFWVGKFGQFFLLLRENTRL